MRAHARRDAFERYARVRAEASFSRHAPGTMMMLPADKDAAPAPKMRARKIYETRGTRVLYAREVRRARARCR